MLPTEFLTRPIAHRGLHDATKGIPENSRAAVEAAIAQGYGIEIDLQLTSDPAAVVFHDDRLDRMTNGVGRVRDRSMRDLETFWLEGNREAVPGFGEILDIVSGRVPLLVELKDQDGALGEDIGPLEAAVAHDLDGYKGPIALMSFNPHAISALQTLAPDVPRGLVTDAFASKDWDLPEEHRAKLSAISDFHRVGASFISHNHRDLASSAVTTLKEQRVPVLCWTVRSLQEEATARLVADNVTFEGYFPRHPS
ncbi:MAG: glycerophosphodiester phosphodiesterase family protein [Pseudomonadota bacterium]